MIKLVVFDMAGTVVDEQNLVYKTLRIAINNAGYDFTLEKVLEEGAGKEKRKAIEDILASASLEVISEQVDAIFQDFKNRLKIAYETEPIQAQPGTEDVYHRLKERGINIALNTGYDRFTALQLLDRLGWQEGEQIDLLVTASDVERGRPFPDMITLAMDKLEIHSGDEVVKIGDSIIDIEEGKQAACAHTIGITTGAHTEVQLQTASPSVILHHLSELIPYLEKQA
ncbi:MAG: phosphonatase-like hydrolase [Chitinophagales bacterium]|nr:phosphonatase-like hydrolase [Chitinophagales bacterium]